MINIVLADDNLQILRVIEMVINAEKSMHVVAKARSGSEGLEFVKRFNPDVLVTDIVMFGMDGIQLIKKVFSETPHVKVIALSMHYDESYVKQAFESGAMAYVLKSMAGTDLAIAINDAISDKKFLSLPLVEKGFTKYVKGT